MAQLKNKMAQQDPSLTFQNGDLMVNGEIARKSITDQTMPFQMPRALPHVYSCFVINQTAESIECTLNYSGIADNGKFDKVMNVTIPGHAECYFPRQFFQADLAQSFCKLVKIVTRIQVKKSDGSVLEMNYPFENVDHPVRNWEFQVRDNDGIVSIPPTRVVNVLKYDNLDQYECEK